MGESPKGISVGCFNNRIHVRVVGRGSFQNSQPLRRFAMEKIDQRQEEFVIDLRLCQGMDSTFLGVLAGIALRLRQKESAAPVHLVNITPHHRDLLRMLGLDQLFQIDGDAPALAADAEYHYLPETDITDLTQSLDKDETADLMLEAHDNLVRADQRNAVKFDGLTRLLRDETERNHAHGKDEK